MSQKRRQKRKRGKKERKKEEKKSECRMRARRWKEEEAMKRRKDVNEET